VSTVIAARAQRRAARALLWITALKRDKIRC
jgi:hypothetical protein